MLLPGKAAGYLYHLPFHYHMEYNMICLSFKKQAKPLRRDKFCAASPHLHFSSLRAALAPLQYPRPGDPKHATDQSNFSGCTVPEEDEQMDRNTKRLIA